MNEDKKEEEVSSCVEKAKAKPSPEKAKVHPDDGVLSEEDIGKVSGGAETVHLYLKASGSDVKQ